MGTSETRSCHSHNEQQQEISSSLSIVPAIAERSGGRMEREGAGGRVRYMYDVIIVGAGNAALCAAHAAREQVMRVLVLEKAPREWAGGNSFFTAGATRTTYNGLHDLLPLLDDLDDPRLAVTDIPPYTPED